MAVFAVCLMLLFYTLVSPSDANYCVCNSAQSDSVLQKNIDYACGHGADCSAIQPNGACYNPNTVKDHCNYAVNSYFQKNGATPMSCNFQGTATVSPNPPSGGSGCALQNGPSTGGTTTPPTSGAPPTVGGTTPTNPGTGGTSTPPPSGGTTPTTPGGGTTTPPTNPAIGGTPTTPSTGGSTNSPTTSPTTGGTPTTPTTGGGGIFPGTGSGIPTASPFGGTDNSASVKLSYTYTSGTAMAFVALPLALIAYDFIYPRM